MRRRKGKRVRKRKCRHCQELYYPDRRRLDVQRYCGKAECRKASQAASWRKWFMKPENRDHYKGADEVDRVREWRAGHPGYWKSVARVENALPKVKTSQGVDDQEDMPELTLDALPNVMFLQPALAVGLIASLTGSALPKDIAETSRRFLRLGQDILGNGPGINPKGDRRDGHNKTHSVSRTTASYSTRI